MYLEENIITHPAIKHTIALKLSLTGSRISVKFNEQVLRLRILQSSRIHRSFMIK